MSSVVASHVPASPVPSFVILRWGAEMQVVDEVDYHAPGKVGSPRLLALTALARRELQGVPPPGGFV